MHVSVNKCELLAEQIVTNVPLRKVKLKIKKDFKFINTIVNEYTFLQNFSDLMITNNTLNDEFGEETKFYIRDLITYILWYEINVKNNTSEAFEYAKQVVNRKWKWEE